MKRLTIPLAIITSLSTAHATDYVIHLDTGMYGVNQPPPVIIDTPTYTPTPDLVTPLPPTIWLFATGLAGLAALRRRR
jgi:hypothetical protein